MSWDKGGSPWEESTMSRKRFVPKPLDTIWEVPDDLWARIEPVLTADWQPHPQGGHPHADWRRIVNGIIYRLRSGCQWNRLPKEFGDDSTMHRWFQRWCRRGVLKALWATLVAECAELGDVHWEWQSADGAMGKARFGGEKGGEKSHGSREKGLQRKRAG